MEIWILNKIFIQSLTQTENLGIRFIMLEMNIRGIAYEAVKWTNYDWMV